MIISHFDDIYMYFMEVNWPCSVWYSWITLSGHTLKKRREFCNIIQYAVEAQTSLAPLSWFHGSRVTTAHVRQCCIFQSYAKTVPSRVKLTMKLTMREPASMTTDTWSTAHTEILWYISVNFQLSPCGPGFNSHHRLVLLSFSKTLYPH